MLNRSIRQHSFADQAQLSSATQLEKLSKSPQFLDRRAFVSTHSRKGGTPYILTNDATACSMKVVRKQSE